MVGITPTSDGRWRRVDNARGIEPFRTATLPGWKTFRGRRRLICATDLCHFPWLVPHRVRLLSGRANDVHFDLPVVSKQQWQVSEARASIPYPMARRSCNIFRRGVKGRKSRPILPADVVLPCLPPPELRHALVRAPPGFAVWLCATATFSFLTQQSMISAIS
jgi:hypothetical protein